MRIYSLLTVCIGLVLLIGICPSQATTHVWITIGPPSSPPTPGSTFTTYLNVSTWDGTIGALDVAVHYDPNVLHIIDFSTPSDSPFYPNCFADTDSFASGKTRIVGFQVTSWETWVTPVPIGIITWQVVDTPSSETDITIEPISVVGINWSPVEVLTYGQHIYFIKNQPPVASFVHSPENPVVDQVVVLNASPSYDPDGTIISYEWDLGDGCTRTGMTITHSYISAGNYSVTLKVTDNEGATNTTTKIITVRETTLSVSISTDKKEYAAGETMLINLTLANPTDEWKNVKFLWRLDFPDYGLRFPIVNNMSLWLPPSCDKTFTLRWRLPTWRLSFNASWYVAIYNARTLELICDAHADWRYITRRAGTPLPEEITE